MRLIAHSSSKLTEGRILFFFLAPTQLQCIAKTSDVPLRRLPWLPLHHRTQGASHWGGHIRARKLDGIWPLIRPGYASYWWIVIAVYIAEQCGQTWSLVLRIKGVWGKQTPFSSAIHRRVLLNLYCYCWNSKRAGQIQIIWQVFKLFLPSVLVILLYNLPSLGF